MKVFFSSCRRSYRTLGLLWAGSSIAHQMVLIPGVVIGESTKPSADLSSCIVAFPADDVLARVGKYGSNIRPAFVRNVPFFVVPFWAAFLLFRRPRVMPITTADKVAFRRLSQRCLAVAQHLLSVSEIIYYDRFQMEAVSCRLDCCGAEEKSPVSAR